MSITGTNFTNASVVRFGGIAAASFSVTNSTTISATLGSGATGSHHRHHARRYRDQYRHLHGVLRPGGER